MIDAFPFPELEPDDDTSAAFSKRETARTEAAFCDETFAADVDRAAAIMGDDSYLRTVRRRGAWVYNFLQNAENPKGIWRRVPDGTTLTPDAPWQVVFDVDAFSAAEDEDWHWRGAEVACFDADLILIALSWRGSDQTRYLEWDAAAQAPVPGGFDLGPERNGASWLDAETLLYSTATGDGAATRAGWPGRVLRLSRGMELAQAPVVFEAAHDNLVAYAGTWQAPDGSVAITLGRVKEIGDTIDTLHLHGLEGPGVALDTPKDTQAAYSTTHYAYLCSDAADHPAGTLVMGKVGAAADRVLFEPEPYVSVLEYSVQFGDRWMFWIEMDRMRPRLRGLDLTTEAAPFDIGLPVAANSIGIMPHDDVGAARGPWQVTTSGFLHPQQTWLMELDDQGRPSFAPLLSAPESFDASGLEVVLQSAVSDDGTEVPYHIVLPKDRDGPVPVLQYGYGGFGVALSPHYERVRGPLWLDRGGAIVMAYIRGGSEFGKDWAVQGKRHGRHKAFEDFAAVARDVAERGYSEPGMIGCNGGSNGGLLCSVMLTRYPERFGAVWANVAVTDMTRFHLFPSGAGWIDEYGDPDDPDDREMLLNYSPMHNVAEAAERPYPPALIDTNDNDDRVHPSHSRRFAAAVIAAGQPGYFHARAGGHGGGGSLTEAAREQVLGLAFLRQVLRP